jgi:hypothetical protein
MRCQYCYQELEDNAAACDHCGTTDVQEGTPPPATAYFYISPLRFIFLEFFTLGAYRIYWLYKNWAAIKKATHQDIWPFLRSLFAIFFYHSLFKRIYRSATTYGYKSSFSSNSLATFMVVCRLGMRFLVYFLSQPWGPNLALFFLLLGELPFLLLQNPIKVSNSHVVLGYNTKRSFTKGEVILLIFGTMFWIGLLAYHNSWREFRAPNKAFSIMLPASPEQYLGRSLPIEGTKLRIKYDYYNSKRYFDNVNYSVAVYTYPAAIDTSNAEELLEGSLADMFSEGIVVSLEGTSWHKRPALDFVAQQNEIHFRGRTIAVGRKVYLLIVAYEDETDYHEQDYKRFIHSFGLKRR